MITKNLVHDIRSPKLHTLYLSENTPYCLKIVFKEGNESLDFNTDSYDMIALKGDLYRPVVEEGEWTNYPTNADIDNTIVAPVDGIRFGLDNEMTIVGQPNYGKHRVMLYFSTDIAEGKDPTKYSTILVDLVFKACCENNPVNGGITLTGEYEDGTLFNYSINALDNSTQSEEE